MRRPYIVVRGQSAIAMLALIHPDDEEETVTR